MNLIEYTKLFNSSEYDEISIYKELMKAARAGDPEAIRLRDKRQSGNFTADDQRSVVDWFRKKTGKSGRRTHSQFTSNYKNADDIFRDAYAWSQQRQSRWEQDWNERQRKEEEAERIRNEEARKRRTGYNAKASRHTQYTAWDINNPFGKEYEFNDLTTKGEFRQWFSQKLKSNAEARAINGAAYGGLIGLPIGALYNIFLYEKRLRKKHPDWDARKISREVERARNKHLIGGALISAGIGAIGNAGIGYLSDRKQLNKEYERIKSKL